MIHTGTMTRMGPTIRTGPTTRTIHNDSNKFDNADGPFASDKPTQIDTINPTGPMTQTT